MYSCHMLDLKKHRLVIYVKIALLLLVTKFCPKKAKPPNRFAQASPGFS